MQIEFLGGAGTVTGSRHLIRSDETALLVDCGQFQGFKHLRRRNWGRLGVDPERLDAVLLTHAHIDHSGLLPVLVREGFRGPIFATAPTAALCAILLRDSAKLAEEDAEYANRKGFSRHHPARPLMTREDAERALERFEEVEVGEAFEVGELSVRSQEAGHILGAVGWTVGDGRQRVHVSGDLGRADDPLMRPPQPPPAVDALLMESTYGGRCHPAVDPVDEVVASIADILEGGGTALVPSFAVGRTQSLLLCLHRAMAQGRLPRVPVHVNSPMATDVTAVYQDHGDYHRLDADGCAEICADVDFVADTAASKELCRLAGPRVVVAASGMLTGGRVLHHLKALAGDPRNAIVLPGYQAPGTRGGDLVEGKRRIKLHGAWIDVRLQVRQVFSLSAHADHDELVRWFGSGGSVPPLTWLVHGEPEPGDELRKALEERYATEAMVALIGDRVTVGG